MSGFSGLACQANGRNRHVFGRARTGLIRAYGMDSLVRASLLIRRIARGGYGLALTCALAGYVVTADGEPLVFAFMVNGFRVPQREIDAAMDRALLRLVRFKGD